MKILKQSFYNRPTLSVAQELLGCFLFRKINGHIFKYKIVETEGYVGLNDLASHASRGKTERNKIMFDKPGLIYVYFTYGMHYMLNIVTEKKGYPAAVLIRAVEPIIKNNFDTVGTGRISHKSKVNNLATNGPAKLTKALKIDKSYNGLPVYIKKHGLWIKSGDKINKRKIVEAKRIGVEYAGKYKDKLWRFYIKDNNFVSKK